MLLKLIADIPGAVMTDVTGFGLARHAVNLSRKTRHAGARLCPEACPFIEGAVTLSEQGLQSSLFASNADGLPPVTGYADGTAARLLFDPQTSGGVLAAALDSLRQPLACASFILPDTPRPVLSAACLARLACSLSGKARCEMSAPIHTTDWQAGHYDLVIDVRSPSEFADDHIPGAINLPALSDEQRAVIGTLYKQTSAFEARKTGAAIMSRNIAHHIETVLKDKPAGFRPLIHCWRGGQRSRAFALVLSEVGWTTHLLAGGYKAYRRDILDRLKDMPLRLKLNHCRAHRFGENRPAPASAAKRGPNSGSGRSGRSSRFSSGPDPRPPSAKPASV